jgi:16S rRNA (uracil1498-N3)-methyltransferase
MTAPMFYLGHEQLRNASVGHQVVVGGDEGRHAVAVKRLRTGETVSIGDGHGLVLDCTVERLVAKESFTVRVRAVYQIADQMTRIIVIQALIKGERMERALETLTEAGVDQISVWGAEHSIARIRADQTVSSTGGYLKRANKLGELAARKSHCWPIERM